jgi:hypothetical protein
VLSKSHSLFSSVSQQENSQIKITTPI